jgi:hypothetical protein
VTNMRHGLFSRSFMVCDRCISNAKCERFKPGSRCVLEQEMFTEIVKRLVEDFDLDNVADDILVERAAMYLIKILRAEGYEAEVGISEDSPNWGAHIAKLDSSLRSLFKDLAINRSKRLELEKDESLLVSLDDLLRDFAKFEKQVDKPIKTGIMMRRVMPRPVDLSPRGELWSIWENDYPKLKSSLKKRNKYGEKEAEGQAS